MTWYCEDCREDHVGIGPNIGWWQSFLDDLAEDPIYAVWVFAAVLLIGFTLGAFAWEAAVNFLP